jgi:hypothetical protein
MAQRLHLEPLEGRDVPAVTVSAPAEAFAWVLVNEMRQDPAGFANQLDGLRRGTVASAFGFSRTDPVVGDLKRLLAYSAYPGHYGQALRMLRSAPPVGALGWDDTLEDRAQVHTAWMKTHAFEHTGQDRAQKTFVAGFKTGYHGGDPDQWGYSGQYYWWGEDIGYTYGLLAHSKAAYVAGKFGRVGFDERAAFIDTVSYLLEVNSPDMDHLVQLLRPDGGPETGTPQFNVVGMDLQTYEGPFETRDGLGEATISTHRLGLAHRGQAGGFLSGIIYRDVNGNGAFDAGEGIGATLTFAGPTTFTERLDRLATHGVSSNYVSNGTYVVTATAADGTPLGSRTVSIANGNGWFEFRQAEATSGIQLRAFASVTAPVGTSGVRPTVTWAPVADAVGYQIRLTNLTTGRVNAFPGATSLGPSWSPPADLVPGHTYRVGVRPLFSDHDGPWGPGGDFAVGMPALSGPHGPTANASPAFSWTGVAGVTQYVLILNDLTTGQRRATVRTTDLAWTTTTPLVNGHVYRWKVVARNAAGQGVWTLPWTFRVTL